MPLGYKEENYLPQSTQPKGAVLAVDGDIVAYRVSAVCEGSFEGACNQLLAQCLTNISTNSGISKMRIYISGANNFRYEAAKTKEYKGNRKGLVRPEFWEYCKQHLQDKYKAFLVDGFEADDAIASDMLQQGSNHCGIDKDIKQIQGWHFNFVKEEGKGLWEFVTKDDAELLLYRQILSGDSSDNIPGLPRIGKKKAEAAIENPQTAFADALDFYKEVCEAKLPEVEPTAYFAEQRNLIRLRRDLKLSFDNTIEIEPKVLDDGFEEQTNSLADLPSSFKSDKNLTKPNLKL